MGSHSHPPELGREATGWRAGLPLLKKNDLVSEGYWNPELRLAPKTVLVFQLYFLLLLGKYLKPQIIRFNPRQSGPFLPLLPPPVLRLHRCILRSAQEVMPTPLK